MVADNGEAPTSQPPPLPPPPSSSPSQPPPPSSPSQPPPPSSPSQPPPPSSPSQPPPPSSPSQPPPPPSPSQPPLPPSPSQPPLPPPQESSPSQPPPPSSPSQPPPIPSLPPLPPSSPSQPTPTQPTTQLHSLRRRSPRLVECGGYSGEGGSDKAPAKKKAKIATSLVGGESNDGGERVGFLIGDPVSDEEARRRWPWRYDIEGLKRKGRYPTTKINSEDDDDELILNVKCHYLQAKILTHVFDIGDCATVKGEEEGHDHVGRILEFFKTNTNEDYFRVQWFFRAQDTVIKDAATSNDKKRVFYSTLMNDNPLDCIISKVKVLKVAPGINLKSIPKCDFYYDMEYNINYSTFSTIKDDVSSNNCCLSSPDKKEEIHSNGSISKEEIHSNGSISTGINGTLTRCKSHKSELTLLDLYSGCGGMSTGLCFGAKLSGVDLSTKWAVDANKCACESLRLNHPETQIRNEYAEDFLDLIKEWDKLCKKYKVKEEKTDGHDPMLAGSQDDVTPSKADKIVTKDEYEVEKLVDICYSDLDKTNKRELKFKVRWAGYGPSDDTWEPIQGLRKCQDKIREFVHKGCKAKILPRPGDVDIICGGHVMWLLRFGDIKFLHKVFHMSRVSIDADQRLTQDLEKLSTDLSGLVTGMVKPTVDILWFTWRMKTLTGRRGVAILYAYMLLGLGFLRSVTPDFGDLGNREQELEGSFRFMHERLRTHAESVAFFGGGAREKAMIESRFNELLAHAKILLRKKWLFGVFDDFVTKQLPHNVTWGLSLLYAMEHKADRSLTSTQGELAHALRFLASVVSQSFLAFGDILELHRKFIELSGGVNRIFELEEFLEAAQSDENAGTSLSAELHKDSDNAISFSEVDIITPTQKLLARKLTCDIVAGKSLLLTGPNGSGKSSVFRVLRGLWPIADGRLVKPSHNVNNGGESGCGILYIPQKPYTCLGTLRDQIIYPLSHDQAEKRALTLYREGQLEGDGKILDVHLKQILENVKLSYLYDREGSWDASQNWEDILSLGEQQRLGMARLFFHKPRFGVLDECTNATSVDVEEHLYRLAQELGITVITSSQRPALIPFHSMELRLIDGEGKWELRSIKQ